MGGDESGGRGVERHEARARIHEGRALAWEAAGAKGLARLERRRALIHARAAEIRRKLAEDGAAREAA